MRELPAHKKRTRVALLVGEPDVGARCVGHVKALGVPRLNVVNHQSHAEGEERGGGGVGVSVVRGEEGSGR